LGHRSGGSTRRSARRATRYWVRGEHRRCRGRRGDRYWRVGSRARTPLPSSLRRTDAELRSPDRQPR
jgi:hypothetical protein